jgi:hypothetical protein
MSKKILINPYVIGGTIVFLLLLFVGVFGIGFSWGESLLASAALTIVGIGVIWWQDIWPF